LITEKDIGRWVVGVNWDGTKTYPGKVSFVFHDTVVFEIHDFGCKPYEVHRTVDNVQFATKQDFDKLILDASAAMLDIENFIEKAYRFQTEVS
jgi:hypothetical protein